MESRALPLALVLESVGEGWSDGLGFFSSWLSHESRRSASLPSTEASLTFAQRTSSTLHQGNARAILKRSPGGMNPNRSGLCLQILSEDLAWLTLTLSPPSLLPLSPAPSVSLRSPLRLSVCLRFLECVGSCSVRLFAGWASQVSGRGCGCLHVRLVSVCHLLVLPGLWSLTRSSPALFFVSVRLGFPGVRSLCYSSSF